MYENHYMIFLVYILRVYLASVSGNNKPLKLEPRARWKFFFYPCDSSRSSSIQQCLSSRFIVLYLRRGRRDT